MTADTILVDGTDLQTAARILQTWGGVHAIPEQRGSGFTVPGRHGIVDDIDRPFAANILSLGMMLRGGAPDVTGFNDQMRTLQQVVKPGRKVTLTRRLSFTGGSEDHTQAARCLPFTPDMQSPADGKFVLSFALLDGLWYGASSVVTFSGAGHSVTDTATADSRRMTIAFPGAGTLTNSSSGGSLAVAAAATLDVQARTTTGSLTAITAVGDPLGAWFVMNRGFNLLSWSGSGSVTITYYPAYF